MTDLSSAEVQAKIAKLKDKISMDPAPTASEGAPEEPAKTAIPNRPDLAGLEFDGGLAHLYERATVEDTPEGPRWVVMLDEFHTTSKNFSGSGLSKKGEPQNLGEYLNMMLNGSEGWKIATFFPSGAGMGAVLLQRKVKVALPTPTAVKLEEKVEKPTDEELQDVEKRTAAWVAPLS